MNRNFQDQPSWSALTTARPEPAAETRDEISAPDAACLEGAPRTILMTTDAVGGVWNYALELSRGLAAHDVKVVLATMGPRPSAAQRADAAALRNVELVESDFRLEWMEAPWGDLARAGDWLLELERHHQPDLVHLNGYAHGALPWRAPTLMVGHSCVLSWWHAVHGTEAPAEWNRYRNLVRTGLHAADTVIAPSRTMLASLVRYYGALPRSEVIPNGCDNLVGGEREGRAACRAENWEGSVLPCAAGAKEEFVLSVGRLWDPAKNLATLACAAADLGWPVRVAGDIAGPSGAFVAGVPDGVELLGRLAPAELATQFARAAIYALPARYEPFGLSVLEAALGGCALVLGDIPSLRENWDGAAEFVPPDDAAALAACVNELASQPTRRAELSARARARARHYSRARLTSSYLEAYARCLAVPAPILNHDHSLAASA